MTVSEKIKYYRNMRGISQEMLGELSSINSATIKKYEYGIRRNHVRCADPALSVR